jgi:hypothetical protein
MTDTEVIAAGLPDISGKWQNIQQLLAKTMFARLNIIFFAVVVLYACAIFGLSRSYGTDISLSSILYYDVLHLALGLFIAGTFVYRIFYVMLIRRPRQLFRALINDFRDIFLNPRRILTALPLIILMPVFLSLFTSAKNLIPYIHPFSLDPVLTNIERTLHFGRLPWEWLQPLIGFALATSIISYTYKTWFLTKFFICLWQGFSLKRPRLREQFFLTFIASWIVNGTILAILLSSAGPCFFGKAYPALANPYDGLMAYLHEANKSYKVFDLEAMNMLWTGYSQHTVGMFSGISAMPSMHVSVAFMFALLGWRINRFAGIFFTLYLGFIMIGSVHIGWHYAIDGYAAILTTASLWFLFGRWIGRDIPEKDGMEKKQLPG